MIGRLPPAYKSIPRSALVLAPAIVTAALAAQQVEPRRNPLANNPATIAAGQNLFDRTCQTCHGPGGQGDRAPALTRATFPHGHEDAEIFRTIRDGVRGTQMPPYRDHTERRRSGSSSPTSRACGVRPRLRRPAGRRRRRRRWSWRRTRDGREIRGLRRNEDTFTVQIVDAAGQLHSLDKLALAAFAWTRQRLRDERSAPLGRRSHLRAARQRERRAAQLADVLGRLSGHALFRR